MKLFAPAKVNWTLEILGRRADGFHELRSWFCKLDLADVLEAELGPSSLTVKGPFADGVPTDASNLIFKAEEMWREAGLPSLSIAWTLTKNIPHGAGLGGGSSNAAAAIRGMLKLAPSGSLKGFDFTAIGWEKLGSDLPFFLSPFPVSLQGGQGEVCLATGELRKDLILVKPKISLPTPAVYQALRAPSWDESENSSSLDLPNSPGPNHLEEAAFCVEPALKDFAEGLREVAPFQMTGSGSAFFAVCDASESAELQENFSSKSSWVHSASILRGTP